ncbi:hypothetical protein MKK55_28840 [Methylobacterium sp. J-059]|uniref:DUF6883 domain-containing protein n=1 Tax=Methylobacterium sp. J-059 TaxID=2836643 RepID=UPI001FBB4072|nr:DUF6883 domain-containing protein [Methylobacterium sp. J-059]MCJ2042924.1 hypothetical protein [Methylobacterium sp. J-059]
MKNPPQWPEHWYIDRRKITNYLLDLNHPVGGSKAKFFTSRGFRLDNPEALADALYTHRTIGGAAQTIVDEDGDIVMLFEGPIMAPDRSMPLVRSVWRQDPLGDAHFVTAYPIRKVKL